MIARRRRAVDLPNYRDDEGICSCGCGMQSRDQIMLACQAFCDLLSRIYGAQIQHRISGGARCPAHNAKTPGASPGSQHTRGLALDGTFWYRKSPQAIWTMAPVVDVAALAKASGLFGGVGHELYSNAFVHLDVRAGWPSKAW